MAKIVNQYDQPVGPALSGWSPRPRPGREIIEGSRCRLEPLDTHNHSQQLYEAYVQSSDSRDWTYMTVGPFNDAASFRDYIQQAAASADPLHYTVIDTNSQRAVGTLSLMRIDPVNGVIEVGNVMFSPLLQRTPVSTEAQYLLMKYAFETLGYRRYEWKCDSLNEPSRRAATRLGFTFEGVFRQALIYKGRNRDTAWYSIIDGEWPALRTALQTWLSPENFNPDGRQKRTLAAIRANTPCST